MPSVVRHKKGHLRKSSTTFTGRARWQLNRRPMAGRRADSKDATFQILIAPVDWPGAAQSPNVADSPCAHLPRQPEYSSESM